jgi:hypothetical protein
MRQCGLVSLVPLLLSAALVPAERAAAGEETGPRVRLSLADCVALASVRNIGILQTAIDNRKTHLTLLTWERGWIPSLSASINPDFQDDDYSTSLSISAPVTPFGTSLSLSAAHSWSDVDGSTSAGLSVTQSARPATRT